VVFFTMQEKLKKIVKKIKKCNFAPEMKHIPYYIMTFVLLFGGGWHDSHARESGLLWENIIHQDSLSVKFDENSWDFGEIAEDGGAVSHVFTFTNISSSPVVVLDVSASCGCTSPSFSRKPVMPNQKGEITVSFDPINRPGHFSKGVSVRLSTNERVTLKVEGSVNPRQKSVEELYPFEIGEGLRLDSNFHAFSYVGRGEQATATIVVYNTSDKDARLALRPTKQSGLLRVEAPQVVKAQGLNKIVLTYDIGAESKRYGMLDDVFAVSVNGIKSKTLISTHAIAVDKFDAAIDDMAAPSCELSKNFIKFGSVKHSQRVESSEIEIINDSEAELIIRAVEWKSKKLECSLKAGDTLKAGERRRVKLSFDSSACDYGVWVDRISIITNSPERPMLTVRVTAIVEE
jgi:hypothetical protein